MTSSLSTWAQRIGWPGNCGSVPCTALESGICIGLILKWVCYFLNKALCIIIFFQIQGCPKVADALKKINEKSVLRYQISNKLQRSLKRFVEYMLSTVVSISSWLAVLWDRIYTKVLYCKKLPLCRRCWVPYYHCSPLFLC